MNLADSLDQRGTALTVSDVAELLNISERQVYKLAASNRIPSFRLGGSVRFDPSDVAAWLRQKIGPRRSELAAARARPAGFPNRPVLPPVSVATQPPCCGANTKAHPYYILKDRPQNACKLRVIARPCRVRTI
jgi:excisionase family DNA binding protein